MSAAHDPAHLAHGGPRIRRLKPRFLSLFGGKNQQKLAAIDTIDAEKMMDSRSFGELEQNFRRTAEQGTEQGNNSRLSGKEQAR